MSLSELHPTKIAEICNGYWLNGNIPQFAFHSTVIDSRQMAGNTLFIALKGTHNDGHDFLASLADHPEQGAMVKNWNALPLTVRSQENVKLFKKHLKT